ncbi:MAG: hypothetical protein QXY90_04655 [Candidatus Anstonellales archaeon]
MDRKFEQNLILQERALTPESIAWINIIQKAASDARTTGYIKGGILRDYISNLYHGTTLSPKDLDIMLLGGVNHTVGGMISQGAEIKLRRNRRKTPVFEMLLPTNQGVIEADIGIVLGKPNSYERGFTPGTILEDDARLSDFTVNTLFLPLDKLLSVENLVDPLNGIQDIKDKVIRMVTPNTFVRNPECMLRAVRMADRLSATIEPTTADAIRSYSHLIRRAPKPVVDQNMEVILHSPNSKSNVESLANLGLLDHLGLDT